MDLFDQQNDQLQDDPNKNYLEELVGEDKKFKDVESLAKGKYQSDHYIETLTRSLDELREDYKKLSEQYNSGPKLEELLDRLEKAQQPPTSRDNTPTSNEDTTPKYDPATVESLISSKIQQYEQTKKESDNFKAVQDKVKERFGSNFKDVLKQKADALGLGDEDVNKLARTNPNFFFKTFDVDETNVENFQAPPRSDLNTGNFTPKGGQKRTWTYYQKLRRDNPMLYNDPKTRVQMDKDSQALGMDFFDA